MRDRFDFDHGSYSEDFFKIRERENYLLSNNKQNRRKVLFGTVHLNSHPSSHFFFLFFFVAVKNT